MTHDPTARSSRERMAALIRGPYRLSRRTAASVQRLMPLLPGTGRSLARRLLHRSDYSRWGDPKNLAAWWESRTARLARFVPPGARVIEFGAGTCRLPAYIDPSCVYFASDLVPRIPGTIVCDLNKRPLPDLRHLRLDVAFFAGVLEYIVDLPALASWLSSQVGSCVTSYDGVGASPWSADRLLEYGRRRNFGYMNEHRPQAFVAVFEYAGFRCVRTDRWQSQDLYLFEAVRTAGAADGAAVVRRGGA